MKKTIIIILCMILALSAIAGCSKSTKKDTKEAPAEDKAEDKAEEKTEGKAEEKTEGKAEDKTDEKVEDGADDLPVLRLGMFGTRNSFVTWYMIENGIDIENGFKIEPTVTTSGGSFLNEAVGAGKVDATHMGAAQAVYSASVYDCKVIAEFSDGAGSSAIFGRPDSEEAQVIGDNPDFPEVRGSAETLKGKTFMYPSGSMSQLTVAKYLEVFGLTLDDITSLNTNYGPGYQALQAGEGDTVTIFSPLTLTALHDGYVQLASLDQLGVSVRDCLMVTPEAYENPETMDTIKKYVKVLFEYSDKFLEDPEWQLEELKKLHEYYGTIVPDPDKLSIEVEKHYLLSTEQAMDSLDDLGKSALTIGQFYYEIGLIEEDALERIENNVDKSIMEELFGD
ncbi:MAG: hypothetical protein ACOX3H_07950 [Saccharofermentanales bacterium]|jgi:sulfonate transport system substrate-binding protein